MMRPPLALLALLVLVAVGGVAIVVLVMGSNGGERSKLCDKAVAALLHSNDLVEVERAGILVYELDCGISRRAAEEEQR